MALELSKPDVGEVENHDNFLSGDTSHMAQGLSQVDADSAAMVAERNLGEFFVDNASNLDIKEALQKLTHIRLDREKLVSLDLCHYFLALPALTHLYLQENELKSLEGLKMAKNLKFLTVAGNHITKLEGLSSLSQLMVLDVSHNDIMNINAGRELPIYLSFLNIVGNPCCVSQNGLWDHLKTELPNLKEINGDSLIDEKNTSESHSLDTNLENDFNDYKCYKDESNDNLTCHRVQDKHQPTPEDQSFLLPSENCTSSHIVEWIGTPSSFKELTSSLTHKDDKDLQSINVPFNVNLKNVEDLKEYLYNANMEPEFALQKILTMTTGSFDYPTMAIMERIAERVKNLDNNDHEAQKDLLHHRVLVHTPDPGGRIALTWAVVFGDCLTTRRVIKCTTKKGLNMVDDIHGCSALHYAVMEGRTDVVKSLLNKGAHVNIANQLGMTPLHYAAQTLNELMIKMLIARKANLWYVDNLKRLPYHVALQWGSNPNILHLLEPKKFHIRRPGLPAPVLPATERTQSVESIDDHKDHLRRWVLAAKQFAANIEKARSRDHVVEKVKKEMNHYIQRMNSILDNCQDMDDFAGSHDLNLKELQLREVIARGRTAKNDMEFARQLNHQQMKIHGGFSSGSSPRQSSQASPRQNPLVRPSSRSTSPGISRSPSVSLARAPVSRAISRRNPTRSLSRSPRRTSSQRSPMTSPRQSPRVQVASLKTSLKHSRPDSSSSHKSRKSGGLHAHFEDEDSSISCCSAPGSCVIGCAPSIETIIPGGRIPQNLRQKSPLGGPPLSDD